MRQPTEVRYHYVAQLQDKTWGFAVERLDKDRYCEFKMRGATALQDHSRTLQRSDVEHLRDALDEVLEDWPS